MLVNLEYSKYLIIKDFYKLMLTDFVVIFEEEQELKPLKQKIKRIVNKHNSCFNDVLNYLKKNYKIKDIFEVNYNAIIEID